MQKFPFKPLSDTWLKAAVIGSLWASVEIIAGSFLHNLRIPFSGTLLSCFSVFLIIAFLQLWGDAGIIWRAGLVCALMKSLSPSAVIIGPMIGIMSEAVIIWIFIILFGKNLFSYMLGGAVAVASALLHKFASLLILYGFNLVKIVEGIYQYTVKLLRIETPDPVLLIGLIIVLYMMLGIIAAIMGYFAGKKHKIISDLSPENSGVELKSRSELFTHSGKKKYSLLLLFSHLVLIIACLWSLNTADYFVSIPLCSLYIVACFLWYRESMRFLRKTGLWIQFVLITMIAAFLLEGYSSGDFFNVQGFIVGLKMNIRAFIILTGFSAISVELKNPLVRTVLYKRGFASLYPSLNLAFSALPDITAKLPKTVEFFKNPNILLSYLFSVSIELLSRFKTEMARRPSLIIISGEVGQGKTTYVTQLLSNLRENGLKAGGFLSPGIFMNNRKEGFLLNDIQSGRSFHLSSRTPGEGWLRYGQYYFDPEVISKGNDILINATGNNVSLIVIDEVGPFEMADQGWAPAIDRLCMLSTIPHLWIVRRSLATKVCRKWNFGEVYIFNLDEDKEEEIVQTINSVVGIDFPYQR